MTPADIQAARAIIAAAERGETLCVPVGKVARTGWALALDEIETLTNDYEFQINCCRIEIEKLRAEIERLQKLTETVDEPWMNICAENERLQKQVETLHRLLPQMSENIKEAVNLRAENERLQSQRTEYGALQYLSNELQKYRGDDGWIHIETIVHENKKLRAVAEAAEKRLDVWTRETYIDLLEALKAWRSASDSKQPT